MIGCATVAWFAIESVAPSTAVAPYVAPVNVERPAVVDTPITIMGAGDIAIAGTAGLLNATATGDLIRGGNPDAAFTLGDNAYPYGTATDYAAAYEPTWGSFKGKTRPTPGNHEYSSNPPAGYLEYFGATNVTNASDGGIYYAWDVGSG